MTEEMKHIILNAGATVKEAIKRLDLNDEKILFIVDDDEKLVGSLTDGDVRRWILREGTLGEAVSNACFRGTYFVEQDYEIGSVKEEILKRSIDYVPVLDETHMIVDFLVWEKLFEGTIKRKSKGKLGVPVIIMAGGKGTRLDPFTKILPKPLIPIGDRTILEIIIEKFLEYYADEFYLSINHKAKIIKSYFEELQPSYSIKYLYEEKPLGTVGAVKQLQGRYEGNLILTNCDVIIEADYADILKYHTDNKNDITLVASLKHFNIPYGICEIGNGGKLINIREKPEFDFLVNTGMYVLHSGVFDLIPEDQFFHITDLIKSAENSGKKVGVYPISENSWTDVGEWIEYKKAVDKIRS